MKLHEVKTQSELFNEVRLGRKTAEIRVNDRNYQANDVLIQHEVDSEGHKTGASLVHEITHVLQGGKFGLSKEVCVLSLSNSSHLNSVILMGHLRDRLVEAADCMEAGIDVVREAGLTTADLERQIQDSRYFATEATTLLKKLGEEAA